MEFHFAVVRAFVKHDVGDGFLRGAIGYLHAFIKIDRDFPITFPVQGIEDDQAVYAGCNGVGKSRHTTLENMAALVSGCGRARIL